MMNRMDRKGRPKVYATGPKYLVVEWFGETVRWAETWSRYDAEIDVHVDEVVQMSQTVPVGRWFPAQKWAWKHAEAWRAAMAKRHKHASIEETF